MNLLEILNILILIIVLGLLVSLKLDVRKTSSRPHGRRQILLDTSTLIDGRVLSLAESGFLGDQLLVTRSVIGELQLLADGSDSDKRSRARHGLDIISALQKIDDLDIQILADQSHTPEGVDNRLLRLAKAEGYLLCTLDFNLNKVAKIEGIKVLNINELAQNLRLQVLPGEVFKIKLTQAGQGANQAVGYLSDGTMVVVADAKRQIGQVVEVEAVRSIQTEAGKMLFADLAKKLTSSRRPASKSTAKPQPKKPSRSAKPVKRQQYRSRQSAENRLMKTIKRS